MITNKDSFFRAVPRLREELVPLPAPEGEAHQTVKIRMMSVGDRIRFEDVAQGKKSGEVALLVVIASVVDDAGNLMFTVDDLPKLEAMPINVVMPIMEAALKLNALNEGDVDELAKN